MNKPRGGIAIRRATPADLDALITLENRVFSYDRMSRRSARNFISSDRAVMLVAGKGDGLAGYVLVLLRPNTALARLYSIAVAAKSGGQGVGTALLAAAEAAARKQGRRAMRLEVKDTNRKAIRRYRRAGYQMIGRRPGYYDDGGDALRFEKTLIHKT